MILNRNILILGFLALFGCVSAHSQSMSPHVNSFEECLKVPHVLTKMHPPSCITKDGKIFSNPLPSMTEAECVDRCGDGFCDEVVCMGSGCPCGETITNCPKDCK